MIKIRCEDIYNREEININTSKYSHNTRVNYKLIVNNCVYH